MKTNITEDKAVKKKQLTEQKLQVLKFWERIFKGFTNILNSPYTQIVLIIICLAMTILCLFSMCRLNKKLNVHITEEAERNALNLTLMEKRFIEWGNRAEQNVLAALKESSEESLKAIRSLDVTIQDLLDAQKRRTLESFYREDVLTAGRKEAAAAFSAGRYVTANLLYREIAAAHQNDQEARFFQYYALFLNNKMDRDNYPIIKDAMILLEKQGYTRKELTETLKFIANEAEINEGVSP